MTDLKRFIDLYKQFGIDVKVNECEDSLDVYLGFMSLPYDLEITESDKFHGYGDHWSQVEFTKEGRFVRQGFFEG